MDPHALLTINVHLRHALIMFAFIVLELLLRDKVYFVMNNLALETVTVLLIHVVMECVVVALIVE
jgi:hypothetical protein